ncbi:pyocin knob domain-containing protein [Paenibacillus illinoisensis]|uniref:Uncharacterized protein n=1 Tax=Paenibacillus illinoisensis TaxID=59845 RepID=A0A2W0C6Y1_9BACL|nr:pyocin knob domain-containing protein [Paenibacillus illinoisensis]PYY27757.1 Uncharacterized protein PIL02S_04420 [Paenibacillus illinoisensis]
MNEPKTPNLGLNKIDRSSPSTTYFDLDKYLDQNWEKVDGFAEQVEEKVEETAAQVSGIQERLDTEKRRSVTLEPGLQIINAERASPFKLEGLKGRTLVNLLGRDGNGESLSGWLTTIQTSLALDTTTKYMGASSIKVTATGSAPANEHYVDHVVVNVKVGSYYVLAAKAKPQNIKTKGQLMAYGMDGANPADFFPESNIASDMDKYTTLTLKFNPKAVTKAMIRLRVLDADGNHIYIQDGQAINFDSLRLYEISASDYAMLETMTPDQMANKYPYVDSVQAVRNPYVIRYGDNLLPPFYNWALPSGASIDSSYNLTYTYTSGTVAYNTVDLPTVPGQTYTLSVNNSVANARNVMNFYDINGTKIDGSIINGTTTPVSAGTNTVTFQAPVGAKTMRMYFYGNPSESGTVSFSNPILVIGNAAKPFNIREDAMLVLQTDLFADSVTGSNADELFEKDGHYFKLAKWKKLLIDSKYSYSLYNSYPGGKCVRLMYDIADRNKNVLPIVIKFNGTYLLAGSPSLYVDQYSRGDWDTGANGEFLGLGVSSADSGWGDSYTPTPEEIKAYFMGYFMYTAGQDPINPGARYNGSGTKVWTPILNKNSQNFVTIVPSTQAPNWLPYQLVYQLATPTFESITSEGRLTFIEGNNQVEVGTGMVLREPAKPIKFDNYDINTGKTKGNATVNAVSKWIALYENGHLKPNGWGVFEGQDNGKAIAIYGHRYNPSAAYSVTYLMKEACPALSFVGFISENEKALLTDLTTNVQQNTASISALQISAVDGGVLKNYVDNKPWQKYKITQDNGSVIQLPHNSNLNSIKTGGQYDCFNAINVPGGVANAWFYIEVLVHSNAPTHVIQRASRLDTHNTPTLYMRTCMDNTWSAWSPDVFQSGVDAKKGIVDAINAMGSSASMNDTWSMLASKIGLIKTGKRFATGQFVIGSNGAGSVNGLAFKPRHITFANATNTPRYIYFGVYSEESPRNNYSLGGTSFFNRIAGLDNGLSVDDKIVPTVDGFNVSGTGITDQRTYNYFATE